jgi:hypothetical protein
MIILCLQSSFLLHFIIRISQVILFSIMGVVMVSSLPDTDVEFANNPSSDENNQQSRGYGQWLAKGFDEGIIIRDLYCPVSPYKIIVTNHQETYHQLRVSGRIGEIFNAQRQRCAAHRVHKSAVLRDI